MTPDALQQFRQYQQQQPSRVDTTTIGAPTAADEYNSKVIYDPSYGWGTQARIDQAKAEGGYQRVGRQAPNVATETAANNSFVQQHGGPLPMTRSDVGVQTQAPAMTMAAVPQMAASPFTMKRRPDVKPWLPNYRR